MKKIVTLFMSIICVITCTLLTNAEDTTDSENTNTFKDEINKYETFEDPFPREEKYINTVEYKDAVEDWIYNTKNYLENEYNQSVIDVQSDNETITFTFLKNSTGLNEQVDNIVYYIKHSRYSEGDVKVTTLDLGWDNGGMVTQQCDFKSASNIAAAASISISLIPGVGTLLSAFISSVASATGWVIDSYLPVQGRSEYVSYTERKVGSYYLSTGVWYPNVQIGKHSYWYYKTAYQPQYSGGPYVPRTDNNIPNSTHSNASNIIAKNHYYDNTWIRNKSLEIGNSPNGYFDL